MLQIPDIKPVAKLCIDYKVRRLYLMGSALTDRFTSRSDIDFYVIFSEPSQSCISGLKSGLQNFFGRIVDIHLALSSKSRKHKRRLIFDIDRQIIDEKFACFESEENYSDTRALVTIALPVWNAKDICWLSMESFCRQMFPFELIIFEEEHPNQLGRDWFFGWEKSLKLAGCTRILYLTSEQKYTLAEKWCAIAEKADSTAFCFCGCDDYYDENMCRDAYDSVQKGHDYIYETRGYFYHIMLKKMILYSIHKYKGLMQSAPTDRVRNIKPIKKNSGVDRWIHDSIRPQSPEMRTGEKNIVCTDGFNNISKRTPFYTDIRLPFYPTERTIFDILPRDVAEKLISL